MRGSAIIRWSSDVSCCSPLPSGAVGGARTSLEQRLDARVARNAAIQIEAPVQPIAQRVVAFQQGQRAGAGCPIKSAEGDIVGVIRGAAAEKRKLLQVGA